MHRLHLQPPLSFISPAEDLGLDYEQHPGLDNNQQHSVVANDTIGAYSVQHRAMMGQVQ